MKRIAGLFMLLAFISPAAVAQEELGLNPPSLQWQQMTTPAGRIIFPKGLDSLAYRAAGIMAYQQSHDRSLVGAGRTRKVATILQNQSAMPAGFSTPAPWRNEFHITPPQNLFSGPVPWLDYLTIHEYRHAQQFHLAHRGFTLAFKILLGQTGWLLHTLINQPLWFREGDAVAAETLLTKAGRGRQPAFHKQYRALRLSGYHFGYEKAHMPASYRDFVPNPYRIGYYMTTKLRRDFGDTIWQKVLYDTYHANPVYGFNRSLKKHTGWTTKTLYQQTVQELDRSWQQTDSALALTPAHQVSSAPTRTYTNYRFPHYLPDGSVLALKDAFDEIRTFYRIAPDGSEQRLFPYGVYTEDHVMFAAAGQTMAWAESGFDERWVNQDYSIIKTYNLRTGEQKKITSRTRFFAPAPSPDGRKIVAVQADAFGRNAFVVLDAATGKLLQQLPNAGNPYLAHPRWRADNRHIVALAVSSKGNSIIQVNTLTGETQVLLPFTPVPITRPSPHDGYVYFSAGYSGIDNIYALQESTGKIYQVTSVRFGAYEPAVSQDGKKLLYSNYTALGYELAQTEINPAGWPERKPGQQTDIRFHAPLLNEAENHDLTDSTFRPDYPISDYHALTEGLFNIYGWFPTVGNNQYGAEFYTRNLMSTLRGTGTLFYNAHERAFGTRVNLSYAAFYPVFNLEYGVNTNRKAEIRKARGPTIIEQQWTERYALAEVNFPFRLTQGPYRTNLEIGGAYGYYDVDFVPQAETPEARFRTGFPVYRTRLAFSRLLQQARSQVKPRWGQTAQIYYQKAMGATPKRFSAYTALFFPGLKKTHSLNFESRWQQEAVQNSYRFTHEFMMPRGYQPDPFSKVRVTSANYELPLWYPDLALGRVAFFQRLRTNLFYDHSQVEWNGLTGNLHASGAELFADLRLLRLFSMTMCLRYNYVFNKTLAETTPFQFLVTRFELTN